VEEHTNLAFRSWDDICKPPEQGGLGIRDTRLINNCFIIRSAWNIATNKNIVAILKAKYYPDNTFWTASNTTFYICLLVLYIASKHHIHSNAILQIHNGNSSTWYSSWTENWEHTPSSLVNEVVLDMIRVKH
jgi:hypothetical protein